MKKIDAQGIQVYTFIQNDRDYISLTDIARYKNQEEPKDIVKNWMRNRSTINFLGAWERINNPDFKGVEFDSFRSESGENYFVLSPQRWIEKTGAIGLISRSEISRGISQSDSLYSLNQIAISQLQSLTKNASFKKLESKS